MVSGQMLPFDEPVWEIEKQLDDLRMSGTGDKVTIMKQIRDLERRRDEVIEVIYAGLTPWQRVQVARHADRPGSVDYIRLMVQDFVEIHGDRRFGEDSAIITGFGKLDGRRVMLIGHRKGRDTREKLRCNFGMPHPEGYRKALRAMKLAEKYGLPVVTLIDTPGAYPGIGAEERGEAEAIAENLFEMAVLRVPIVSVVTGEGCSGGAIGIGLGDHVALLQYAYYAVISPEGCAAILWKTGDEAPRAAEAMQLTADRLLELGLIDEIIPEPPGGAHRDPETMAATLKAAILEALGRLEGRSADVLVDGRQEKYRRMGVFLEDGRKVEQALEAMEQRAPKNQKRPGGRRLQVAGARRQNGS